jgi:hypothetical protein
MSEGVGEVIYRLIEKAISAKNEMGERRGEVVNRMVKTTSTSEACKSCRETREWGNISIVEGEVGYMGREVV